MLFVNFASLIDGRVLNEPSIASFTNIVFDPKKVKIGDIFIGKKSDIAQALKQGAYGIVSTSLKVKDEEIAWIEVDSLKLTKQKLIRYLIIQSNLSILLLNNIEYQILLSLVDKNSLISLDEDSENIIKKLQNFSPEQIIVSCDEKILNQLDIEPVDIEHDQSIKIIKYTTFLTTFTYKDNYYKDIKLPKLFIQNLKKVLNLLDILDISYNINRINFINHFKPIFVDSYFKIKSFGQSTKVLIIESDKKLIKSSLEYLDKSASWANTLLLLPKELENQFKSYSSVLTYKNFSDIKNIDISNLNFVIILDIEFKYENYLIKQSNEIRDTLF